MTADIAVEIRTLEPTTTIAVRLETTVDRLSEVFDKEMPRIGAVLSDVGGQMAGPPFARYHHYGPDRVDVEVGAPIAFVTAGLQPISGKPDGIIGVVVAAGWSRRRHRPQRAVRQRCPRHTTPWPPGSPPRATPPAMAHGRSTCPTPGPFPIPPTSRPRSSGRSKRRAARDRRHSQERP